LPFFARAHSAGAVKLLRAAAQATDNETRAIGSLALGQHLKYRAELPELFATLDEATLKQVEAAYGKEFLAEVRKIDPEKVRAEAQAILEMVEKKYADVQVNGQPLGEQVKPELFEMRHLAVGKVAPDIEGEDLDGAKFKLSDYHGKVVVIDFWGNW
jgi:hypothetical protein